MKYKELETQQLVDSLKELEQNNVDLSQIVYMTQHPGWEVFKKVLVNKVTANKKAINECNLLEFEQNKEKVKFLIKENRDFEYVLTIEQEAQQFIDSNNSVISKISSKLQSILHKK